MYLYVDPGSGDQILKLYLEWRKPDGRDNKGVFGCNGWG